MPGPSGGQQQSTATAPAAAAPSTAGAAAGGSGSDAQEDIKVKAFQELIDGPLKKYGELSSDIGGLVAEQVSPRDGMACHSSCNCNYEKGTY